MRRQVYAFIVRELKMLVSDKAAFFWVVMWPLFWLIMVAYVFAPPSGATPVRITLGVVDHDNPIEGLNYTVVNITDILSNVTIDSHRVFELRTYDSEETLIEDLKRGKLDAGIIIPANFTQNLTLGSANIEILIGARDPYSASVTQSVLKGFIGEINKLMGLAKIELAIKYIEVLFEDKTDLLDFMKRYMYGLVTSINASYRDVKPEALATRERGLGWYVIGAIGMTFLTTGLSEGASVIYREKTIGSLKRILVAPVTSSTFIVSYALGVIVMLLFTAAVIIIGGVTLIGAKLSFNPLNASHWIAVVLFFIGAYMSFGIGLVLSMLAKTYRGASSLGVILGLLLSFTTGVWFPKTWMPEPVRIIADYSPFTIVIDAIRGILVFDMRLIEIYPSLTLVVISTITITLVDIFVYKYRLRRALESP